MARKLYDYRCDGCGALFESFEAESHKKIKHPECGHSAHRVLSPPKFRYLHMGVDSAAMTTSADKWARMHVKQAKHEERHDVERARDTLADLRREGTERR